MTEVRDQKIEEIMNDYGEAMVHFAYTYVKDWGAAEDVTQDAFIKIYDRLHTFKQQSSLKTWLFGIIANQSKDYLRKNFVKKMILGVREKDFPLQESSVEQHVEGKLVEKELAQGILSLPVKDREVIILYYYEDLSVGEISRVLGAKVSTVKSRLQRARVKLRSSLREEVNGYASEGSSS